MVEQRGTSNQNPVRKRNPNSAGRRTSAPENNPFRGMILILKVTLIICVMIIVLQWIQSLISEPSAPVLETTQPTETLPPETTVPPTTVPPTTAPTEPDLTQIPASLLELMERNPEATDYVLNYPAEHDKPHEINMDRYQDEEGVPLFIQWDPMWGYLDYGGNLVGLSGCGPICLSMAGSYVTGDYETFRPDRILQFALDEGYRVPGNGTMWALIDEGGEKLGLHVEELPLVEGVIAEEVQAGHPVILIVGPGVFTEDGHFIVVTDYIDGKFKVNDPNSPMRSEKLWDYDEFADQVGNLWAISAG